MGTRMKAAWPLLLCIALLTEPSSSLAQSEDLATESQRAKEFMAEGKFAEAIPLYSELNHALPNNPGLLLNLGMALHMAGDERKSIPQLEAAVKLDPNLGPAWLFLGAARLQLGDALEAVEPLRAVLRLQPDHQEARLMLAGALLSLERNAEAAQEYRKLADLSPASSPAWYGLGRSYEALSIRAFHQLEKTAPESAYWLALVAEARLRQQRILRNRIIGARGLTTNWLSTRLRVWDRCRPPLNNTRSGRTFTVVRRNTSKRLKNGGKR